MAAGPMNMTAWRSMVMNWWAGQFPGGGLPSRRGTLAPHLRARLAASDAFHRSFKTTL